MNFLSPFFFHPQINDHKNEQVLNWLIKAAIQRTISLLPAHESVNYLLQKHVTKNLPISDETLHEKIAITPKRVNIYSEFGTAPLERSRFMEFGAGWDLAGQVTMFGLGVRERTLLDITPHLRYELINNTLSRIRSEKDGIQTRLGKPFRQFPDKQIASVSDLAQTLSIHYRAPLDASNTSFANSSFDFISTNSTLEHIRAVALQPIMRESYRILKPGGVICHFVDMKDHYSYFDTAISKYDFLWYSRAEWERYNSPVQYQNRPRLPEYRSPLLDARFQIVSEDIDRASDTELEALPLMEAVQLFRDRFSEDELSAQIYRIVAVKNV